MAAHTIHGDVYTGDVRKVQLAPGAVQPPDDIEVPAGGAHNLPRRPNPVFVGREDLLAEVAEFFTPPPDQQSAGGARAAVGQAITGLGGIGKSELALQYAHRRTGPGAVVWWADAETADTLELALADLAYRLQPKTAKEWTTSEAAAWAVGWLQAHTGWLLVLDNVENPALITGLLGRLMAGDILLTTRRDITWTDHGVISVHLDLLPRTASVELLRERLARSSSGPHRTEPTPVDAAAAFDADAADALAAELGDLPLALQQAAGYLTAHRLPLVTYLHHLRQQPRALLDTTAPGGDAQRAVARVFTLTIEALQTTAPAAVGILRALAWLAPVPLPRQVIGRPAGDAATPEVDELLGLLASYSLITLTTDTVAVHRLLQACLREHGRTATSDTHDARDPLTGGQATALAWLQDAVPERPDRNLAGWERWRDLLPHLEALFTHLPADVADLRVADLLGHTGVFLWAQGRSAHAVPLLQRSLAITEAVAGPDHPATAHHLNLLGAVLGTINRYDEALQLHLRALAIAEATLGPQHSDTAKYLNNVANALGALGDHTAALPLRRRALSITEANLGPDDAETALRLDNLGNTLGDLGRYAEALPVRQRALAITTARRGQMHPDTARVLDNVAGALKGLGRHAEAFPLQERALTITEATLDPDHPTSETVRHNLADTLTELGRHHDALALRNLTEDGPEDARRPGSGPE